MRTVDGFQLEAITVQEDPSVPYFSAAVRVTKEATGFKEVHVLYGQNLERQTESEALAAAEAYVLTIVAVNHHGQIWDRPEG